MLTTEIHILLVQVTMVSIRFEEYHYYEMVPISRILSIADQ